MIRLFLLLVIIGAAMVCGPLLAGNKGYVLIAIGDYTIEMTVISAGILALLLYGVLWCTERLLLRLFHIKGSTRRWFSERRRRKARERTQAGALALAVGQLQLAETLVPRTVAVAPVPHQGINPSLVPRAPPPQGARTHPGRNSGAGRRPISAGRDPDAQECSG